MRPEEKELFSRQLRAGGRTYFFDVKEAANKARYLVISETKQAGDTYEHHRVFVFEEHFSAFEAAFKEAARFLCGSSLG